ncbi:MAG: 50S ribosomal protein L29 [Cyanobacteria bacterium SZAS LIN-3]|nr:50S ribosomal protein L29 [Cyanobacteria bacterium SZAS LIN-3]MBS2010478.1 50S ribosomal protein L29 [Cyanobacteria bacterium SZAS TMP-1]
MKVSEMRDLSIDELNAQIDEARKTKLELRFQHALRKLESPAKMRQEKRKLAQLLTILTEKQAAGSEKKSAEPKAEAAKPAAKKPAAKKEAKAES